MFACSTKGRWRGLTAGSATRMYDRRGGWQNGRQDGRSGGKGGGWQGRQAGRLAGPAAGGHAHAVTDFYTSGCGIKGPLRRYAPLTPSADQLLAPPTRECQRCVYGPRTGGTMNEANRIDGEAVQIGFYSASFFRHLDPRARTVTNCW